MDLLVDLGGTNTRVGLADDSGVLSQTVKRFENLDFAGLVPVLKAYLNQVDHDPIRGLCAGVAGPVRGDQAQLTNHDWLVEADALRAATGAAEVLLINDLQAQGYALDDLPKNAGTELSPGSPSDDGATRLVFNIGTGCNVAVVHRIGEKLFVPAAESGHSALPHATGELGALFDHLAKIQPHHPMEIAVSGPGLSNIHEWVSEQTVSPQRILDAADANDEVALRSVEFFAQALGHIAGNFALNHLPMGGLFLSGGLAPRIAPYLTKRDFLDPFCARGPYTEIAQSISVSVITAGDFALYGCRRYLQQVSY